MRLASSLENYKFLIDKLNQNNTDEVPGELQTLMDYNEVGKVPRELKSLIDKLNQNAVAPEELSLILSLSEIYQDALDCLTVLSNQGHLAL